MIYEILLTDKSYVFRCLLNNLYVSRKNIKIISQRMWQTVEDYIYEKYNKNIIKIIKTNKCLKKSLIRNVYMLFVDNLEC